MDEEEHEVYGGEIPDVGEMEADVDMSAADDDAAAVKELDEMKRRLKEMEEEAAALREMQAKVEKEIGTVQGLHNPLIINSIIIHVQMLMSLLELYVVIVFDFLFVLATLESMLIIIITSYLVFFCKVFYVSVVSYKLS